MHLLLLLALCGALDGGFAKPVALAPDAGSPFDLPARDPAEVKRLLAQERANLNAIVSKQQSLLDAVEGARIAEAKAEAAAQKSARAEQAAQAVLQVATAQANAAKAALVGRIRALRPRLRARYELDHGGAGALLLSSASISDLLWRKRTLTRILASDLSLLQATKDQQARAQSAELAQTRAASAARAQHRALLAKLLQVRRARDERTALIQSLTAQRATKAALVNELMQAQRRLQALAQQGGPFSSRVPFEKQKGRLPIPAHGQIEVGFGKIIDAQFGTVLLQNGIDLRAAEGTPVYAIAEGRVVHASPLRGYGNLIIIDQGAGYFTLYAHLQNMVPAVGDVVRPGERIGAVGDTGSLKGAYLHFEIRHHGTPLDPEQWLRR